jgi:hypothetical protein
VQPIPTASWHQTRSSRSRSLNASTALAALIAPNSIASVNDVPSPPRDAA